MKRAAILRGEAGIGGRKRKDLGFEGAAREFLAWAEANKRPKTLRSYRQCLEQLSKSFAGRRLSEIDPLSIERHKHARVRAGAPVAANRELTCLKALFNRCIEWDLYEGANPMAKVKMPRERKERPRFLEVDEEDRLLEEAHEPLRTMILSGIYAGLRIGAEALTLRRPQVDLKRGLLTVHGVREVGPDTDDPDQRRPPDGA